VETTRIQRELHGDRSFRRPGRGVEVPHPIAAGNRLEGRDYHGSIRVYFCQNVRPVFVALPAHRALTGTSWRAT
jgi:hypothetical protein